MTRRLTPAALLLAMALAPGAGVALTGDITHDPVEVVKKYATLDYKGARLQADSQEVLHPYVDWKQEPSWGTVVVVGDYEVREHTRDWRIISMLEVVIPVDYNVLGTMYWESATFRGDPHVERIGFRVKGKTMRWRLIEPQIPPHVGLKRLIQFVRQAALEETDPERLARLTALRAELEQAK